MTDNQKRAIIGIIIIALIAVAKVFGVELPIPTP